MLGERGVKQVAKHNFREVAAVEQRRSLAVRLGAHGSSLLPSLVPLSLPSAPSPLRETYTV